MPPVGEPHESPRPQPIGNMPAISLFTICTLCFIYVLWRRADSLRYVVSHQLKVFAQPEGRIRLSSDDGPSANEFLGDDDDDDDLDDDNEVLPYDIRPTGQPPAHQPSHLQGSVAAAGRR